MKIRLLIKKLPIILTIVCMLVSMANFSEAAKRKKSDDQIRRDIQQMMSAIPEVSWDDLKANEAAYQNKVIKMSGLRLVNSNTYPNGVATLFVNANGQCVFLASTMIYPWQEGVEYTVCGEFKFFDQANKTKDESVLAAGIVEMAHFPWYNE